MSLWLRIPKALYIQSTEALSGVLALSYRGKLKALEQTGPWIAVTISDPNLVSTFKAVLGARHSPIMTMQETISTLTDAVRSTLRCIRRGHACFAQEND